MRSAAFADARRLARATASLPAARTVTVTYGRQVRPVTYPGAAPDQIAEFSAAGALVDRQAS